MSVEYIPENLNQVIQETRYGDYGYGTYIYPKTIEDIGNENHLPDKILFFNFRAINHSAYFLESFITRERSMFTNIELSWNFVKGAEAYSIYKGASAGALRPYGICKENVWYDTNSSDSLVYYQIRPLFKEEV